LARAREHVRVRVRREERGQVVRGRRVAPEAGARVPGLAAADDAAQLLLCGHAGAEQLEDLGERRVLAPPAVVEVHKLESARLPRRAFPGPGVAYPGQLIFVTQENERRHAAREAPDAEDVLELPPVEQRHLVYGDQVVERKDREALLQRAVELEDRRAGVHVGARIYWVKPFPNPIWVHYKPCSCILDFRVILPNVRKTKVVPKGPKI